MRPVLPFRNVALVASSVCTIALTVLLALFPASAAKTIWTGYRVLAVPLDVDESETVRLLTDSGIRDFATESNSSFRNDSTMAPSQPFLEKKNVELSSWFIDREHDTRFLYLRDGPFLDDRLARAFSTAAFSWHLESAGSAGTLPALLLAAYLVALCVFSSQKRTFLASSLPFMLFTLKCADAMSYGSAVFASYGLFLLAELLEPERKSLPGRYRLLRLRRNPPYVVPFAIALAFGLSARAAGILGFSAALGLSVSLSVLVSILSAYASGYFERKRLHPAFRPDFMHPDTLERKRPGKTALILAIPVPCLFVAAVIMLGSGAAPRTAVSSGTEGDPLRVLYIPSPSGYTAGNGFGPEEYSAITGMREAGCVPDLAWFLSVRWNLETAPWRRLDGEIADPAPGTVATIVEYASDDNAVLRAEEKNRGTFDSSFIKKALSAPVTPIEKMLIEQGRFVTVIPTGHMR